MESPNGYKEIIKYSFEKTIDFSWRLAHSEKLSTNFNENLFLRWPKRDGQKTQDIMALP